MKQKMKSLVSVIAVVLMLISMFSVCVVPASAAAGDGYGTLQSTALVVNAAWSNVKEGEIISYTYRGITMEDEFEAGWHFASFEDAWDYAVATNRTNPTIMICGTYSEEIRIEGAVTIIGANAGIDPVVESANPNKAWSLNNKFTNDSLIAGNVVVANNAGNADITFDGVRFVEGGALIDNYRSTGESDLTFKNVVFEKAGNSNSNGYAVNLFSAGHLRNIRLENIYATGHDAQGLISPYFAKLVGTRVAYVNNGEGILNRTSFAAGVAPYIEFTDSCFYNDAAPAGYVISMDNYSQSMAHNINGGIDDSAIVTSDSRPSSLLSVSNCIFYNASTSTGVIHYEFINRNSSLELDNNYFYSSNPTTILAPEFLLDAPNIDLTDCMHIANNRLFGVYKVPNLGTAHAETYIDMSYNFFGDTNGICVSTPIYVNPAKPKLIRTSFWIDPEMTSLNTDPIWSVKISGWDMYDVDNFDYVISLSVFEETGVTEFKPSFSVGEGGTIQLYKNATEEEGIYTSLSNPINKLTMADLSTNIYQPNVFYAQITNSNYPTFAPIYKIVIDNVGSIDSAPTFSKAYPGIFMYQPELVEKAISTMVPYRWAGKVYRMEIGKTLFSDTKALIAYAKKQGHEIPTIAVPAGNYEDEMLITGSCTIWGEQHGVNPNVKPVEVLTQSNISSAGWTLNPARSNDSRETIFNACIRVPEGVDDYVITIDGIKMGEGCSYVDDCARSEGVANVTIFKNVIAERAGGGKDCNNLDNVYLFNFMKEATATDLAYVYLYDTRIDRNQKCHVFSPHIEKLVVDNTFYGNAMNDGGANKAFLENFTAREVSDPYCALTNCCFFNNAKSDTNSDGLGGCYVINPSDKASSVKKNIIYNFDNNLFYNGFGSGNAAMEVQFTGPNMKFYLTNNTIADSKDARKNQDTFFAGNQNGTRWIGDSPSYDCSDVIICKGNRIVNLNLIPLTHGSGVGTLIDYSGNYFADSLSVANGERPNELAFASGRNPEYTEEEHKKVTIDFTYLDWDLTKRSDAGEEVVALYTLNNGMFGTAAIELGATFDKKTTDMVKDTISADCEAYSIPASISAGCEVKIQRRINATRYVDVDIMTPPTESTTYYYRVTVTSRFTGASESFIVELMSKPSSKAELVELGTGSKTVYSYIDDTTKTAYIHTPNDSYDFARSKIVVSDGADFEIYSDVACKNVLRDSVPVSFGSEALCYLQVISADDSNTNVYTVKVTRFDADHPIKLAAVTAVTNMTYVGNDTYEATVSGVSDSVVVTPTPYYSATVKIYDGNTALADNNGKYTFTNLTNRKTYRVVVTAGDGVTTKTYTLRFVYEKSNKCELYSIDGASKTANGFTWNMKFANAAYLNAVVSEGATYQVYADQTMLTPYPDNFVTLPDAEGTTCYVKVTAENGIDFTTYGVSVLTQANVSVKPEFTVNVGNKEYPAYLTDYNEYAIYLPAGVTEAKLSVKTNTASDSDVLVYASVDRSIVVDTDKAIKLDQKVTTMYYTQVNSTRTVYINEIPQNARNQEEYGAVRIFSDRAVINYKDSASIAAWAKPYVDYLNEEGYGILLGDANNNFNASGTVTRYQMAVIAAHVLGMDTSRYSGFETNYSDTIADWAAPYVRAVSAVGLMNGIQSGDKVVFNGTANATRAQVATIMVNIHLMSNSLVQSNSVDPTVPKDGAEYYARYKNDLDVVYNSYHFEDENSVADWAKPYMNMAVDFGLMNGVVKDGKYYLNPQATINRAQLATMVANFVTK